MSYGRASAVAARVIFALATLVAIFAAMACREQRAPRGTGDATVHFLLASDKGITEVTDGQITTLASFPAGSYALDPAVSPDGKQVAFVLQPPVVVTPNGGIDFGTYLYLVARKAGALPRLLLKHSRTGEFVRTPSWQDNGRLLATVRGLDPSGGFDLHIVTVEVGTGDSRRVLGHAVNPVVAPDGSSLLFLQLDPSGTVEMLIKTDAGLKSRQVLAETSDGLALISSAVWSPDGRRIAFAASDISLIGGKDATAPGKAALAHPSAQDIWTVDEDGSGLHRLA